MLTRLDVIRDDHQHGRRTDTLCVTGQPQRGSQIRGAGSRNHRQAAGDGVDRDLQQLLTLVEAQQTGLPGRTADRHTMAARVDLELDKPANAVLVELAVAERGDERGERASERGPRHQLLVAAGARPSLRPRTASSSVSTSCQRSAPVLSNSGASWITIPHAVSSPLLACACGAQAGEIT